MEKRIEIIMLFYLILSIILSALFLYHEQRGAKILMDKSYEQGYLDACKDFYKGKIKYDLVTNPDGTREWKKINHNIKQK